MQNPLIKKKKKIFLKQSYFAIRMQFPSQVRIFDRNSHGNHVVGFNCFSFQEDSEKISLNGTEKYMANQYSLFNENTKGGYQEAIAGFILFFQSIFS